MESTNKIVTAYPLPPKYYKDFLQNSEARKPPAIISGEYKVFGSVYNVCATMRLWLNMYCVD
jgi:hypothetical protein